VAPNSENGLLKQRIEAAAALFRAWSDTDLDGPRRYFAQDGVLYDVIGGEYRGWPAIRAYFARGRQRYPDLVLEPTGDFWSRPDGLAMLWTMSATQATDELGPELVGRRWTVEGMSYLVFDGLVVVREADYHDAKSRERSLRQGWPGLAGVSRSARRRGAGSAGARPRRWRAGQAWGWTRDGRHQGRSG